MNRLTQGCTLEVKERDGQEHSVTGNTSCARKLRADVTVH